MKSRFILLSAFVLLFSACAAPALSTAEPVASAFPATEIPASAEPTQPPVQVEPSPANENLPTMVTYTDAFAGFSLDYPAHWFIDASAAANADQAFVYSVPLTTWDLRNPPTPSSKDLNTMPEGATKIDINVTKQPMTLEEAVAQQSQNELGNPILARRDVTLANGLPAVILDLEGVAGLTRTLITVLNGNVIYVSGYGDLESFEAIALSLRAK